MENERGDVLFGDDILKRRQVAAGQKVGLTLYQDKTGIIIVIPSLSV